MDANSKMITVFTPTFNRAYILPILYESLLKQSCKDFEWLVIDDGSTDGTEKLFNDWIKESQIAIRFYRVSNGGKHRAINKGVKLAKGNLFFIVDSDDKLCPDALKFICDKYEFIKYDPRFCGLAGSRGTPQGHRIGGYFPSSPIDANALNFRLKHKIKGDMAEVFCTEILKKYPFPEFKDENFCPEALIWNRIALKYQMRWFSDIIYITEYLPDGLTAKIIKLRHDAPQASMLYYSELYRMDIPFVQKIKAAINYWRFSTNSRSDFGMLDIFSRLCIPIGKIMKFIDIHKSYR